jgi:hypothetical protein
MEANTMASEKFIKLGCLAGNLDSVTRQLRSGDSLEIIVKVNDAVVSQKTSIVDVNCNLILVQWQEELDNPEPGTP